MLAVGMLLISFRHFVPDSLSIVVANLAIVGSHIAFLFGLERYLNRSPSLLFSACIGAIVLGGFLYFTYATANLPARIVLISLALSVLACAAILRLSIGRPRISAPVEWMLIIILAAHAAFHLFRGVYTFTEDALANDFMSVSLVHAAAFIDIVVFSFAAGITFSIMTVLHLNRSLEDELEKRSGILSIIAHDVRTPFNGLVNMGAFIEMALQADQIDRAKRVAHEVSVSSKAVLDLLEDLINWGHSEFFGDSPSFERINVGAMIEAQVVNRKHDLDSRRIQVVNGARGLQATVIPAHLQMVLRNLLSNAVKFAPSESTIQVLGSENANGVHLTIINQIADNDQHAPAATGMGLGLELCSRICHKNGHRLETRRADTNRFIAEFHIPNPT